MKGNGAGFCVLQRFSEFSEIGANCRTVSALGKGTKTFQTAKGDRTRSSSAAAVGAEQPLRRLPCPAEGVTKDGAETAAPGSGLLVRMKNGGWERAARGAAQNPSLDVLHSRGDAALGTWVVLGALRGLLQPKGSHSSVLGSAQHRRAPCTWSCAALHRGTCSSANVPTARWLCRCRGNAFSAWDPKPALPRPILRLPTWGASPFILLGLRCRQSCDFLKLR